jgi:MATE family multidrug resistance protein
LGEARVLLVTGTGSGAQILADVLAWSLFLNLVIARLGEKAMAANQLMFRYMAMSFMPAFGVGQAVTALVGRNIGAGRPDVAMRRAHLGFVVTAMYMMTCAAIYVIWRRQLIQVFLPDPEVVRLGATLMFFASAYQFFDAMYVVYNGALRGAGDTLMPAVATAGFNWGISVGGGYLIVRFLPQFGIVGPWVAALLYGIVLSTYLAIRFIRGRWKSIHLEADSNPVNDSVKFDLQPATEP